MKKVGHWDDEKGTYADIEPITDASTSIEEIWGDFYKYNNTIYIMTYDMNTWECTDVKVASSKEIETLYAQIAESEGEYIGTAKRYTTPLKSFDYYKYENKYYRKISNWNNEGNQIFDSTYEETTLGDFEFLEMYFTFNQYPNFDENTIFDNDNIIPNASSSIQYVDNEIIKYNNNYYKVNWYNVYVKLEKISDNNSIEVPPSSNISY